MRANWDNHCPSGVSYLDHCRSLGMVMHGIYSRVGEPDSFFVVGPEVAALVELQSTYMQRLPDIGKVEWPFFMGRLGGIPVWVAPNLGAGWEIQLTDDFYSPPYAIIEIDNLVPKKTVLDRMAEIK